MAAGVLTRVDPAAASRALAVLVHHATAVAAALLYGALVAGLSAVLPTVASLNGVPLIPHVVSIAGVTAFIFGTTLALFIPVLVTQL